MLLPQRRTPHRAPLNLKLPRTASSRLTTPARRPRFTTPDQTRRKAKTRTASKVDPHKLRMDSRRHWVDQTVYPASNMISGYYRLTMLPFADRGMLGMAAAGGVAYMAYNAYSNSGSHGGKMVKTCFHLHHINYP